MADIAAALARFRSTMMTPLPPAARSRRPINTIQNTVVPWLEGESVGWLPEVVPPFALVVLEAAGVLPPEGVGVSAEGAVLLGAGGEVGLGGFEPPGMGGLVSEKLA